jgi:hypothetical protein
MKPWKMGLIMLVIAAHAALVTWVLWTRWATIFGLGWSNG